MIDDTLLVVALGGGGDAVSAAMLAYSLRRCHRRVVIASTAWERFHRDPTPGPIQLSEIRNTVETGRGYVIVDGSSYALRGGRTVEFTAARVARALGESIYVVDLWGGVKGLAEALRNIMDKEGVTRVIGVDVGGDSLALGFEEELWSPLADWVGVAAISILNGILAVHSPGSDGELSQQYVLSRIDEIAVRGGLIGGRVMDVDDVKFLERLIDHVDTEASRVPLLAARGVRGEIVIRRGSRKAQVTLYSMMTFYLDSKKIVELNPLIESIMDSESLDEARRILNTHGIYTELDLEEDLANLGINPWDLTGDTLRDVRMKGRERLREKLKNR